MKYQYSVIILGIVVILLPLLHVPAAWDVVLHIIFGVLIIATGVIIHQYRKQSSISSVSQHSEYEEGINNTSARSSVVSRARKLFVRE